MYVIGIGSLEYSLRKRTYSVISHTSSLSSHTINQGNLEICRVLPNRTVLIGRSFPYLVHVNSFRQQSAKRQTRSKPAATCIIVHPQPSILKRSCTTPLPPPVSFQFHTHGLRAISPRYSCRHDQFARLTSCHSSLFRSNPPLHQ